MAQQIRISDELAEEARKKGQRVHRTLPQQVEHWTKIGKALDNFITGDQLDEILSGKVKARIEIERPFSPSDLQMMVSNDKRSISERIGSSEWYVGSIKFPGFIEKHNSKGEVVVGTFTGGKFTPKD